MATPYYSNHGHGSKSMGTSFKPPQIGTTLKEPTGQVASPYHTNRSGGTPRPSMPMEGGAIPKVEHTKGPKSN